MSSFPVIPAPPSDQSPVWGWVRVRALVLNSLPSRHSKRVYGKALDDFWEWSRITANGGFTRETVQLYRSHLEARGLAASSANLHLTAIRKLAQEGAAHGLVPDRVAAAIIGIKGIRQKGVRLGTWLTLDQAHALLRAPAGHHLRAVRDRALLAILVGCGLRREELAALPVETIPQREGRWVLVDIEGKGHRFRSVPMPAFAKAAVDQWTEADGIAEGRPLRAISQGGEVGSGLTAQAVYLIVRAYAAQLGIKLAPHDLRPHLRQARSPGEFAALTNSDLPRPRLHPHHRTLPQCQTIPHRRPLRSFGHRSRKRGPLTFNRIECWLLRFLVRQNLK